jgi:hypothetical protein
MWAGLMCLLASASVGTAKNASVETVTNITKRLVMYRIVTSVVRRGWLATLLCE